jgi:hypothetical protein
MNLDVVGNRAAYEPPRNALLLRSVAATDQGVYQCRVDFRTSPTLTYTINLTVISEYIVMKQ